MKKMLKVCVIALSMAALFVSCANDSTPAPDYYDINVPGKPEGYKPAENVGPVKDGATASMLVETLFYDINAMVAGDEEYVQTKNGVDGYNPADWINTKGYFMTDFAKIGLKQKFIEEKKANTTEGKFSVDLTGNYKAEENPNLNINLNKCAFGYEITKGEDSSPITYSGFANINGNIKYDLTNHFNIITRDEVKDHEWKDENDKQYFYKQWSNATHTYEYLPLYLRESHVKTLSGKVIVNGDGKAVIKAKSDADAELKKIFINQNNYVDSVSGKLSALVNLSGFFDTGVYNGILNVRGKLSNSDLNKLYTSIQGNDPVLLVIKSIMNETTTSKDDVILLLQFLDDNNVSFNGELSISDINGRNTQSVARFENFIDFYRFVENMDNEKA